MEGISNKQAVSFLNNTDEQNLDLLIDKADKAREKFFQKKITPCSIINAKCGGCTENCAFCAQSHRSKAKIDYYPLVSEDEILNAAEQTEKLAIPHFSIVSSGREVSGKEIQKIADSIKRIKKRLKLSVCASLGILDKKSLQILKNAGLDRYHNNLETSESFFPQICSTRNYKEQIQTIRNASEAGLKICCGGIFGMGESNEQRVEMLDTIRHLNIDSVPINFLTPVPGTPLENMKELSPEKCLKIIAVARLMLPEKHIRICGGREFNLKNMQNKIFKAGADGIMVGGYLVTSGNPVETDFQTIKNEHFELKLIKN